MIKLIRLLAGVVTLVLVSSLAVADKPDPRGHQLGEALRSGQVLKIAMVPLDDEENAPDAGFVPERDVALQVSEKWVKLSLDKQTDLAKTIAGYFFDNLNSKSRSKLTLLRFHVYRNEGSPGLGMAETSGEGTVVVWEDWYSRDMRRREAR